jgi:guanylate kinase
VIILSGPSGAGKTTLHDSLLESAEFKGRIIRSISATTRQPRGQEKHGREYLFLSKRRFEYKIRAGHFLEWARVFDNYYGTPIKNVRDVLRKKKNVLLCIDVQGGREVKKKLPGSLMIFVKTPDIHELRHRLEKRGTDQPVTLALRIQTAQKELAQARYYDYVIVNDELSRAFNKLKAILRQELV